MNKFLIEKIDQLLPQTQCRQCSYSGCLPYATAIVEQGEALNRCPPGGVKTLQALGELLQKDVTPLLTDLATKATPPMLATIREIECIGCTKCIQACPVDAIIGSAKQLHTVINQDCTGCGLCVTPCPVDCIDMIVIDKLQYDPNRARKNYNARKSRLAKKQSEKSKTVADDINVELIAKKAYIQAAVARAKQKKHDTVLNK